MLKLTVAGTSINLSADEARHIATLLTRAANPAAVFEHSRFTGRGTVTVRSAPDGVIVPKDAHEVTKSHDHVESDC